MIPTPCTAHSVQLLAASQFIVEEKFLVKYRAPVLLAVGLEGFWGLIICGVALPALQHVHGPDGRPMDNFATALAVSGGRVAGMGCWGGPI